MFNTIRTITAKHARPRLVIKHRDDGFFMSSAETYDEIDEPSDAPNRWSRLRMHPPSGIYQTAAKAERRCRLGWPGAQPPNPP